MTACSFDQLVETDAKAPTLIEGLPGHGLVASITVEQIAQQLELEPYGGIRSEEVPPVLSFTDGLVHDTIRVKSGRPPGADHDVLTLHGDILLPEESHRPFSQCVLNDLADRIERGIFLAAAPAKTEEEHGKILGVATDEDIKAELLDAGIDLAEGDGLVGGITGALVDACYHQSVPAALLLVRADPYVPDPEAAQLVIDHALEPLVDFEVDTDELLEQAKQIQARKAQIAEQLQHADEGEKPDSASVAGMFQ